jgi:hypothetical protein
MLVPVYKGQEHSPGGRAESLQSFSPYDGKKEKISTSGHSL